MSGFVAPFLLEEEYKTVKIQKKKKDYEIVLCGIISNRVPTKR